MSRARLPVPPLRRRARIVYRMFWGRSSLRGRIPYQAYPFSWCRPVTAAGGRLRTLVGAVSTAIDRLCVFEPEGCLARLLGWFLPLYLCLWQWRLKSLQRRHKAHRRGLGSRRRLASRTGSCSFHCHRVSSTWALAALRSVAKRVGGMPCWTALCINVISRAVQAGSRWS